MKKLILVLLALLLIASVCYAEDATATYTIYNVTGEKVTELYAIDTITGEKGENYAATPIEPDAVVEIVKTVPADKTGKDSFMIDLTYVTESGRTGSFPTLHFETVPISLLSEDAMTGATPISFFAPEMTATYTIYNTTGEKVVALYAANALTGEMGENYAATPIEPDGVVEIVKTATADKTGKDFFVIELSYVTESGRIGTFSNLHFETVPISLLSTDAMTGATPISFFAPEKIATYTIYNTTGEKVVALYAANALTGEMGENYAATPIEPDGVVEIVKAATADKTGKDSFMIELSYVTESGRIGTFPTLHFETVPISLLSTDAMTGATAISFTAPAK